MRVFTKLNLLRVLFFLLLVFGQSKSVKGQIVLYQDVFKGGVTASGTSFGISSFLFESTIQVNIDPNSTIRKAFLVCYESLYPSLGGIQSDCDIIFNNTSITLSPTSRTSNNLVSSSNTVFGQSYFHNLDVTDFVTQNQNDYSLIVPDQLQMYNSVYRSFYLIVLYNKNSPIETNFKLLVNTQDLILNTTEYIINNNNPIYFANDIALAVHSDILRGPISDNTNVLINNNSIGVINGSDINNQQYSGAGVKGSFFYENGILQGLEDDTPDIFMNQSDGIAVINNYLNSNDNFTLKLIINNSYNGYNNFVSFPIVYTTTCQEFPVAVSNDTTICRNAPLQLSASGGTQYLWQPATDLSCSTCPNPIFTGDSSRFYTVRIWNNDSCSVVRPIKVNVTQLPEFSSITTSASTCESATGKILASSSLTGESYSINGGTPQATGNFFNLAPGFYIVTLQALNGCSIDSIVEIGSVISTNAHFTANPAQGNAPLMVNFSNQSTNANNYEWFLNGVSQGNNYTSELFDSIGIYTVQLIAWQNDPTCADTAFQTISVTSAGFYILGSSLVSASSNSQNTFSVLTNGTPIIKVNLYDAQGRLLKTKTNLHLTAGSNTIWSASELSDIASEMVLYRIEWQNAAESGELKGKVLFLK